MQFQKLFSLLSKRQKKKVSQRTHSYLFQCFHSDSSWGCVFFLLTKTWCGSSTLGKQQKTLSMLPSFPLF